MSIITVFFTILIAIFGSAILISSKIYKALQARENKYALGISIACFVVSFIIICFAILAAFGMSGGFSRI